MASRRGASASANVDAKSRHNAATHAARFGVPPLGGETRTRRRRLERLDVLSDSSAWPAKAGTPNRGVTLRQRNGFQLELVAIFAEHHHRGLVEFADVHGAGERLEDLDPFRAGLLFRVAARGLFVDLLGRGAGEIFGAYADAPVLRGTEER